jgi:lysophospholipase L1-like esterase
MKKIKFLVLFHLLAVIGVNAQEKHYDTKPYIPEYHQKRLELFASEPVVTEKIIFLGDSITEFGDWKKLLNGSTAINRGIAGDNTFGVLDRTDEIIARKPSKLFIQVGINDISQNIPEHIIIKNIYAIVQKVKTGSPATKIFLTSILPTNDAVKAEYPDAYNKNNQVVSVNKQLKKTAKKTGFIFIDLYKKVRDKDGKLSAKYAGKDGLHLSLDGYKKWIELLKKECNL